MYATLLWTSLRFLKIYKPLGPSGLSILLYGVISLPDTTSYDKGRIIKKSFSIAMLNKQFLRPNVGCCSDYLYTTSIKRPLIYISGTFYICRMFGIGYFIIVVYRKHIFDSNKYVISQ